MTNETKQKFFNEIAHEWDSQQPDRDVAGQIEYVRRAVEHKPARVLDAGCGTGVLVPHLRKALPSALITELDVAPEMLKQNREKHGDANIEYLCSTLEDAPAAEYDAVLIFCALPHFDIPTALKRSAELLTARGRLAICCLMNSDELNVFHAKLHGPVTEDRLPKAGKLAEMIEHVGLHVLCAEEREGWYFVLAEKNS